MIKSRTKQNKNYVSNDYEKKNMVPKGLKEEYPFAKTGPDTIETLTKQIVAWVIICLYLNIW